MVRDGLPSWSRWLPTDLTKILGFKQLNDIYTFALVRYKDLHKLSINGYNISNSDITYIFTYISVGTTIQNYMISTNCKILKFPYLSNNFGTYS